MTSNEGDGRRLMVADQGNRFRVQFTLAHLFVATAVVAAILSLVALDRKWRPRPPCDPTLIHSRMDAPYTYELALGHPDQDYPNSYYVCTALFEPQSSARQMQDRAKTRWRRGMHTNTIVGGTISFNGAPAAPPLPFSYHYISWQGPAGAYIYHAYLRDPKTIDFSKTSMAPYERETAASQIVDAFEKAGWTILCVSGDVRRK